MTSDEVQSPQPASADFLLEEYRMLQGRFHSLRNEGINRLNFFLTFTSAVLGGTLLLGSSGTLTPTFLKLILLGVLVLLTGVGFDVFQFIVVRDIVTDRVERGMSRIRRYFIEQDGHLKDFVLYPYYDDPTDYLTKKQSPGIQRTAQTIQAFTAGLGAAIITDLVSLPLIVAIGIGLAVFGLDFYALDRYARRQLVGALDKVRGNVLFPRNVKP
jgi:hypothetical protein